MDNLSTAIQELKVLKEISNACVSPKRTARQQDVRDSDFEKRQVLGRGSYATVTSAVHIHSGLDVALKEVPLSRMFSASMREQLQIEINTHRRLRHVHIVRLFSYYMTSTSLVLVLELCSNGTVRDRLTNSKPFSEKRAARYLRQISRAVKYLHEMNIAHRDIKLENILLDKKGVAKLADFGWCREMCEGGRSTVCGTLDYLSPEMLDGGRHDSKTDVWSLGVAVVEMLVGSPPFYNDSERETLKAIREKPPQLPSSLSADAQDLIQRMLQKSPQARLSIQEVLDHPWTNHDKTSH